MPKGVMLSHDNFIFSCKSTLQRDDKVRKAMRMVSYLPLSHAAGQFIDIYMALITGSHIFFADPTALTGSLVQTLQEVRPQAFFSVPRVWEKIYEKMMEVAKSNTGILSRIGNLVNMQEPGPKVLARREL
jgi:long-chain-fatty-acid--CoA ligase ACSBG